MKKEECKIGETFHFKNINFVVKKADDDGSCKGCYFNVRTECRADFDICACSRFTRKDKTNVIFIKVDE